MKQIFMTLIILFLSPIVIHATTIHKEASNYYITYKDTNNELITQQMNYYYLNESTIKVYDLNLKSDTDGKFGSIIFDINDEKNQTIKFIMYYGYDYENHKSNEWYIATQIIIWNYLYPEKEVYLSDSNKNKDTRLDSYTEVISSLIKENKVVPSFNDIKIPPNTDYQIKDKNKVLSKSTIINSDITYKINNNTLKITATEEDEYHIQLRIYKERDADGIIYAKNNNQFMIRHDNYSYFHTINIKTEKTKLNIKTNIPCTWGLYNQNNELQEEIVINNVLSLEIKNNITYIKEIYHDPNYYIDNNKYEIVLNTDNNINLNYLKNDTEDNINESKEEILINPNTKNNKILFIIPLIYIIEITVIWLKITKKHKK